VTTAAAAALGRAVSPASQCGKSRSFRRAGWAREQALALLDSEDPVPVLSAWSSEMAPAELAQVLHAVASELRAGRSCAALREVAIDVAAGERSVHLDLLLLPSIFAPEAWGQTFLEGLLRAGGLENKHMVELGTGSGWVSLALLGLTGLSHVTGVDLNPQAVLVSRLNAVLNGFDASGRPRPERFHERFESLASDLLSEPRRRGLRADLVVGCIPQVIAPGTDMGSARGLYDLSNYAPPQGVEEDAHGLGLNARALSEALHVLKPGGAVILNLAGRPGEAALRRMFRRRGFEPEVLWRARVEQAADTDIQSMVELESRTGAPFSFYLDDCAAESVSARSACEARGAGLPIFHDLLVVKGVPRSEALSELAASLGALRLEALPAEADLSSVPDEQVRFVAALARDLGRAPRAPYPHEAGDPSFRQRVADFVLRSWGVRVSAGEIFAAPSRRELLHAVLLALVERGETALVHEDLRAIHAPALAKHGVALQVVSGDEGELCERVSAVRPRLVLLPSRGSPAGLRRVLLRCEEAGALLVLDGRGADSTAAALALLGERRSRHLAIAVEIARGREPGLALLFTPDAALVTGLEAAAEVTYSRISCFEQASADRLIADWLASRASAPVPQETPALPGTTSALPLRPGMKALLATPPFARPAPAPDVVRLDYGENELPLPMRARAAILRGFLSAPEPAAARDWARRQALSAAADYLRATRLPAITSAQVVLDAGALPLLFHALKALEIHLGRPPRVLLPGASYGMFTPLVRAAGGALLSLPTHAPDFLATPEALDRAPGFDVLLLTNPANPSGASYDARALRALIQTAARRGARVVLDEVFGLLADLAGPLPAGQGRFFGLEHAEAERLLVVCSASKEFAAGGLRLGWGATTDAAWRRGIESLQLDPLPHATLVAAATLLGSFAGHTDELVRLREDLLRRRTLLARGLRSLGFALPDERGRGGLFLFADVSRLSADPEAFVLDLESKARVRLNTPSWSGTPSHARACFAVPEEILLEALSRLRAFLSRASAPVPG
jgi:aspartate/methionine/tyrosine aminotransferase/methylase of polypeptide subunit release factors